MFFKLIEAAERFELSKGFLPQYLQRVFLEKAFIGKIIYDNQKNTLFFLPGISQKVFTQLSAHKALKPRDQAIVQAAVTRYIYNQETITTERLVAIKPGLTRIITGLNQFVAQNQTTENKGTLKKITQVQSTITLLQSANSTEIKQGLKNLQVIIPATGYAFDKDIAALRDINAAWPDLEVSALIDKTLALYYKKAIHTLIAQLRDIQISGSIKESSREQGVAFKKGLRILINEIEDEQNILLENQSALVDYSQRLLYFFHTADYYYAMEHTPELTARLQKINIVLQTIVHDSQITPDPILAQLSQRVSLRNAKALKVLRLIAQIKGQVKIKIAVADNLKLALFVNAKPLPFYWRWLLQFSKKEYRNILLNLELDLQEGAGILVPYRFATGDKSNYQSFVLTQE